MRRFETPPAPPDWTGHGAGLIRIVDPLGAAIAWLAPDYGGACVGYAIRHGGADGVRWTPVLRGGSPREWRHDPAVIGVAILVPTGEALVAASKARWELIERDPTAATCAAQIGPTRLHFTARLDAASLHLDLRGDVPDGANQPLALGLRLTFADDLRLSDRAPNGVTLTSGDNTLRLTLGTTGQDSSRWHMESVGANVSVEAWGACAISIVVRYEG